MKKRPVALIIFIILIVVGGVFAAFATGFLYAGIKSSDERVVLQNRACDDSMISRYNYFSYPLNDEDSKRVASLDKEVRATDTESKDPTCQAILFHIAANDMDVDNMQKSLDAIKRLRNKSVFIDPNFRHASSIQEMEGVINSIRAGANLYSVEGM